MSSDSAGIDTLIVHVEGIGWWSPGLADWNAAAHALREDRLPEPCVARPSASILPPNERRRAPDPVLLACDVGAQACAMAAHNPAELPCVFASSHGDIAITDDLCTTLAHEPLELSPTRFHNSVHNAAVGYWTMAAHCHAASSAISAWHGSFAAGLLEAAIQSHTEQTPVLFSAYDNALRGPLMDFIPGSVSFGVALIVNAQRSVQSVAELHLRHVAQSTQLTTTPEPWTMLAHATPMAASLPLFIALARKQQTHVALRNGAASALTIEVKA
ncbi:MAG: beta-ketoacyl synthase chain length factor [Dokdonella sp.]